jgi:hypothetical protein
MSTVAGGGGAARLLARARGWCDRRRNFALECGTQRSIALDSSILRY